VYRQDNSNYLLRLIYTSIKSLMTEIRLLWDLEEPTKSVMATGSGVFSSCVEEIDVSGELKNEDSWLRCGWKYMKLFWGGKVAQDWRNRWVMVPGIGGLFQSLGRQ